MRGGIAEPVGLDAQAVVAHVAELQPHLALHFSVAYLGQLVVIEDTQRQVPDCNTALEFHVPAAVVALLSVKKQA